MAVLEDLMLLKLSDSVEPASQPQTAYLGHTYALALNVQRVVSDAISCLPRYFLVCPFEEVEAQ